MFDTLLFTCAICEREIRDYPKRTGRYRQIAPICAYCMKVWAVEPGHGAFMDRRIAAQIGAVASRLATLAYSKANPIPSNWREL